MQNLLLPRPGSFRLSLREVFGLVVIAALASGFAANFYRLRQTEQELERLRAEIGYLPPTPADMIAAVRAPSDQPLTFKLRVRVPETTNYRVAYSTVLPRGASTPAWYAAATLPGGESYVTVRIDKDPRDERWKISTLVRSRRGTQRTATVLPPDQVAVFRQSHQRISTGVGLTPVTRASAESLRLLDERWLVGEGALLLYGDRPPDRDQIGVYAELQPDDRPL